MRKCGFHSQNVSGKLRDAIHAVQPTVCVSLAHDASFWNEFAGWVYLIGRLYEGAGFDLRNVNPEEWAEKCAALNMPYHAFTTPNEPAGNDISSEDAKRLDDWCCRFRHRLLELGYEAAGPNIATGNWHGDAIVRYMPNWCQEATLITLHEYSARAMWDQNPKLERPLPQVPKDEGNQIGWWYTGRYRGWKRAICDKYPHRDGKFKMVLTETGVAYGVIDGALGYSKYGDVGWQTDLTQGGYIEGLLWATDFWNQDDYLLGGAIFMVGNGKWGSFETLPLYPILATFPEAGIVIPPPEPPIPEPPPEPEPNGGNDVGDIRVIDLDYNERDFEYAKTKYGVAFRRAEVGEGEPVYRLIELWEKEGPANLCTQVLDENGVEMADVDVAFYWPDAPSPPDPPTEVYSHDWYQNFVHGSTNVNGDVCPGLGPGAYHGEGEGGPHAVWIRDPNIPTDICEKLGMLGMTNHMHLDQKFQLQAGGETPSPPPSGGEGMFVEVADRIISSDPTKENAFSIRCPTGRDYMDTRLSLYVVGADPDLYPDPFTPKSIRNYAMELFYTPSPGETERTFKAVIEDWREAYKGNVLGEFLFQCLTGQKRQYEVTVEWQEEGDGGNGDEEPPPIPPSGEGIAAELTQMGTRLKEIGAYLQQAKTVASAVAEDSAELASLL